MTNEEKFKTTFGGTGDLATCLKFTFEPEYDCNGHMCASCKYNSSSWLRKEYKEPKVIEQKITKNFYTLEDAITYLQENKISDENFVSFQKLELCTYTIIRGCWELVYRDKVYIPAESEDKECQQNK